MSLTDHTITISLGDEKLVIARTPEQPSDENADMPEDADEHLPGM